MYSDQFRLENLLIEKQNEHLNLERRIIETKNYKKSKKNLTDEIFVDTTNKMNNNDNKFNHQFFTGDEIIRKIFITDLEVSKEAYQRLSKQFLSEKALTDKNEKIIDELQKEFDEIKSGHPVGLNTQNTNNNLNTFVSTEAKLTPSEMTKKRKENIAINKIEEVSQLKISEDLEGSESIAYANKFEEDISANKKLIKQLESELHSLKKSNDKLEKDLSVMNSNLSDKVSLKFQLEMELDRVKEKRKKKLKMSVVKK
jgi:hypothetical protein